MKKNAMLKIAAILMVAVLLTTCAISSTFAKYVTDGADVTDDARVAKWGVTFTTKTNNLFLKTYDGEGDVSVNATASEVVAPGTTNTASVTTDIVGTPEVAFKLITTAAVDLGDNTDAWKIDTNGAEEGGVEFYCPLQFKINTGEWITSEGCANAGAFEAKINAAIGTAVTTPAEYAAGEYLTGDEATAAFSITWKWAFEGATGDDAKDTLLGNAAESALATVSVTVTQTAQQIDTYTP
jgi:hypothetical protein